MATNWYPAPSLKRLEAQVNARWPNRSRASDGFKGDDAHANRVSDHNPAKPKMVVRAWDVTSSGIDKQMVVDAALADPRVAYVITDGRIAKRNRAGGFTWEKYTGPNGHFSHIHISVRHFDWAEDDTSEWRLAVPSTPITDGADMFTVLDNVPQSPTRGTGWVVVPQGAGKPRATVISGLEARTGIPTIEFKDSAAWKKFQASIVWA